MREKREAGEKLYPIQRNQQAIGYPLAIHEQASCARVKTKIAICYITGKLPNDPC